MELAKPGKFSTGLGLSTGAHRCDRAGRTRTVGRRRELAAGREAVGYEALEEDGLAVGTREVDGGGVASRA